MQTEFSYWTVSQVQKSLSPTPCAVLQANMMGVVYFLHACRANCKKTSGICGPVAPAPSQPFQLPSPYGFPAYACTDVAPPLGTYSCVQQVSGSKQLMQHLILHFAVCVMHFHMGRFCCRKHTANAMLLSSQTQHQDCLWVTARYAVLGKFWAVV